MKILFHTRILVWAICLHFSCNGFARKGGHLIESNRAEVISKRESRTYKQEQEPAYTSCPYPFKMVTKGLCLYSFCPGTPVPWDIARDVCKELDKTSDLSVINNANELRDIQFRYLAQISGSENCNYWIGAIRMPGDLYFKNIDGTVFPQGTPFWTQGEPSAALTTNNTLFLNKDNFFFLDDNSGVALANTVPLCRIIQEDKHQTDHHHHHHQPHYKH